MVQLGAEATDYGNSASTSRSIYKYKHEYYHVDEILFWDKPCIVIEWTDRLDHITDGVDVMEDIAPFPYDLSDEEIRIEVAAALQPTAANENDDYRTNRIAVLAEPLYEMGLWLKRYDAVKLMRKKYRTEFLHTISAMQYILQWMQKGYINEREAIEIVRKLDSYQLPNLSCYQARFLEAHEQSDYSEDYYTLLSKMASTLQFCTDVIATKFKAEYHKVWKTMRAFHNAPRAFLSVAHPMHCSIEQARTWANME